MSSILVNVEAIPLKIPLERRFRGSHYSMTHRCTIVTRITTEDGIVGEIYNGDEMDAQADILDMMVHQMGPLLIGEDLFAGHAIWDKLLPFCYFPRIIRRNKQEGSCDRRMHTVSLLFSTFSGRSCTFRSPADPAVRPNPDLPALHKIHWQKAFCSPQFHKTVDRVLDEIPPKRCPSVRQKVDARQFAVLRDAPYRSRAPPPRRQPASRRKARLPNSHQNCTRRSHRSS